MSGLCVVIAGIVLLGFPARDAGLTRLFAARML
jgi:hypothetical protein